MKYKERAIRGDMRGLETGLREDQNLRRDRHIQRLQDGFEITVLRIEGKRDFSVAQLLLQRRDAVRDWRFVVLNRRVV